MHDLYQGARVRSRVERSRGQDKVKGRKIKVPGYKNKGN